MDYEGKCTNGLESYLLHPRHMYLQTEFSHVPFIRRFQTNYTPSDKFDVGIPFGWDHKYWRTTWFCRISQKGWWICSASEIERSKLWSRKSLNGSERFPTMLETKTTTLRVIKRTHQSLQKRDRQEPRKTSVNHRKNFNFWSIDTLKFQRNVAVAVNSVINSAIQHR